MKNVKVNMNVSVCLCMLLWCELFFVTYQKFVKTAHLQREGVTAAASGQQERVRQLMPTTFPRLARVSPKAPLIKFSIVSLAGTASARSRHPNMSKLRGMVKRRCRDAVH